MLTKVNKQDRLSMAQVINAGKRKRGANHWDFRYDTIHGDQWMIEMGSGDMETRTEWIRDGETAKPILVVKMASKIMVNAFVGYNFKSKLVWCNKHGSLKGESAWLTKFFTHLETREGECTDFGEGTGEACMNCENWHWAAAKAGHSFQKCLETLKPGMVDGQGRPKRARPNGAPVKLWMDAAPC